MQSLQSGEENKTLDEIRNELKTLKEKTNLVLQWIPAHCGIPGNEKADELSKTGSKSEQPYHSMNFKEAKTIIKSTLETNWKKSRNIEKKDEINLLNRAEQVTLFRLRTGHCRLLSHMYRLKISHTDECPCGTGIQTPEHILQDCPTFSTLRQETWSTEVGLQDKLFGPAAELRRTAEFTRLTGLTI